MLENIYLKHERKICEKKLGKGYEIEFKNYMELMRDNVEQALIEAAKEIPIKEHTPWGFVGPEIGDIVNRILRDKLVYKNIPLIFKYSNDCKTLGCSGFGFYFKEKNKLYCVGRYYSEINRKDDNFVIDNICEEARDIYHERCKSAGLNPGGWIQRVRI